jgi:DNA-directed RNA polymerase alpha subunit
MTVKSYKNLRTCNNGHAYYKRSDCPVCPICEKEKKGNVFLSLSAPAQRALENAGITSVKELSRYSAKEILSLHGMGKSSIPKLKEILKETNLHFRS